MQDLIFTHPLADRPLVEFMFSIPRELACGPGEPRRLMRNALQEQWPPQLRQRRSKDHFNVECANALRPLARKLLTHGQQFQVVERGYVRRDSFILRLNRLCQSLECNEHQLRNIILIELWLRKWNRATKTQRLPMAG